MNGTGRPLPARLAALLVFEASGAVLVLEIVGLRLIAPYVGVTLQTSSAVIGTALAAIAYGAWSGGWLADRIDPRRLIAPAFLLGGATTAAAYPLVRWAGLLLGGDGVSAVLLLAAATLFLPAALLSAITPLVVKLQLADLNRTGTVVGRLSGVGTLGAITATFVTGFVLVAALPSSAIVFGLAGLLALTAAALAIDTARQRRTGAVALVVLAGGALVAAAPNPCDTETAYHCAQVVTDRERPSGRFLWLNSAQHSYVDLDDPRYLRFEYAQTIGSMLDVAAPAGEPVDTLHLGGGGLTVPGYLAATRPGSRSRVLEVDGALLRLVRQRLRTPAGVETWVGDARVGVAGEPAGAWRVVVGDAFGHLAVPWHLTTREMVQDIRRVLRSDGIYALNVIDAARGRFVRAEAATLGAVFPYVAVVAPPDSLAGRGHGSNYVLLASASPLPLAALSARLGERGGETSVADWRDFAGGARPLTDDHAPVDQLLAR